MARSILFVELLKKFFPRRPSQARITQISLVARQVEKKFFAGDDLICLPKDKVITLNQDLSISGNLVLPSQLIDRFIDRANYLWIMNFCICRASMKCSNYPVNLGCLFMGEAVLGINPRLGHRVTREEARLHVQKCREAGLIHIVGKNKLDTWWLGIGPGEKLFTVCSCCPCCCITRGLSYAHPLLSSKLSRMPGVTVSVGENCTGCGICTRNVCFARAITLKNGRAVISDQCRACGRCVEVCPQRAIKISIASDQYVDQAFERLAKKIDVS